MDFKSPMGFLFCGVGLKTGFAGSLGLEATSLGTRGMAGGVWVAGRAVPSLLVSSCTQDPRLEQHSTWGSRKAVIGGQRQRQEEAENFFPDWKEAMQTSRQISGFFFNDTCTAELENFLHT